MQFVESAEAYAKFYNRDEPNYSSTQFLNYGHLTDVCNTYSSNQLKDASPNHLYYEHYQASKAHYFDSLMQPSSDYERFENEHQNKTVSNTKHDWVKKVKPPAQQIVCNVCSCTLNSLSQADAHFKGHGHQKKLSSKRCLNTSNVQPDESFQGDETVVKDDVVEEETKADDEIRVNSNEHPSEPDNMTSQTPLSSSQEGVATEPPTKKKKVVISIPCSMCNLVFNSEAQADQHFRSKRHLKSLKIAMDAQPEPLSPSKGSLLSSIPKTGTFHCSICSILSNSRQQFSQHCLGQGHKKKVIALSSPENQFKGNRKGWFHCRICDISCQTAFGLHKHVTSEEHKGKSQS